MFKNYMSHLSFPRVVAGIFLILGLLAAAGVRTSIAQLRDDYRAFRHLKCHEILATEDFSPWINWDRSEYRSAFYSTKYRSCMALTISWGEWKANAEGADGTAGDIKTKEKKVRIEVRVFDVIAGLEVEKSSYDDTAILDAEYLRGVRNEVISRY